MNSKIPQLIIKNGSGWNNYSALRNFPKYNKLETRKLLKANGLASVVIEPAHPERPEGIAVRFYILDEDEDLDTIVHLGFGQNDTGDWIFSNIFAILNEGVNTYRARRAAERKKAEEDEARRLGFASVAEMEAAERIAQEKAAERAANAKAAKIAQRRDPERAALALSTLAAMLRKYPRVTSLSSAGMLLVNGKPMTDWQFMDRELTATWMLQNGHAYPGKGRAAFFDAAKKAAEACA